MDSNLRPFKCKTISADNGCRRYRLRYEAICQWGNREDIIICYRLLSIFLFIDLSTVTKYTQYNPYSINLSGYCITIFISYFCLLITILLRNFSIWEIYDELTLDISHENLSLRFSWFPACIPSIW